ncbi:MAG: hypothetical protein WBV22_05710 [Anaerolineaceae bacterium]
MIMKRVLLFSCATLILVGLVGCIDDTGVSVSESTSEPTPKVTIPHASIPKPPSPTPGSKITLDPTPTGMPQLHDAISNYHCSLMGSESPSKLWLFYNICNDPIAEQESVSLLYNQKTNEYRVYPYCAYINTCDKEHEDFIVYISAKAWSADGEFLYAEFNMSGGDSAYFPSPSGLLVYNLTTGVSSIYHAHVGIYEFSTDSSTLVIIDRNEPYPPVVIIRDLADETDFSFTLESQYVEAGNIVWSPDDNYIAFIAVEEVEPYSLDKRPAYSVMLIELSTRQLYTIIDEYANRLYILTWRDGHILEIVDEYTQDILKYSIPDRQLFVTPMP